jgi:hypothetical protein
VLVLAHEVRKTHEFFSQHLCSARNLILGRCTWLVGGALSGVQVSRTDNERNHGGSISTGGFETLDQLLDLPDLNVLLRLIGLLVLPGRHGRGGVVDVRVEWWWGREIFLFSEGQEQAT